MSLSFKKTLRRLFLILPILIRILQLTFNTDGWPFVKYGLIIFRKNPDILYDLTAFIFLDIDNEDYLINNI